MVTGRGALTGAALARHEDVDKISFTGSTAVGKELVRTSADTMKRLTLELGGKSPVLVLADADLERAIPAAARAIFSNSGQVCSAGSRLIVADEVADEVVAGVAEIATRTRPGYWSDPDADIGPLISAQQLERVMGYVDGAREAGSGVSAGGRRVEGPGWFVEPTVLTDVGPDVGAAREEIFGPVVVVSRFDDVQEAIQRANDTEYGLAASIWTRDVGKAHAIGRRLRVGRVGINVHSPGDYRLPSGGFKQSGVGREHGPDGLDPYLETKSVFTRMEF